jgi:succinate dehydrogenase / fumarate reductase iron-sulfur subunit
LLKALEEISRMTKNMETQKETDVIFHIRRYSPEIDREPYWQRFTVHVEPGMVVLDGLHRIREIQDPSLTFRYSCRMGVCGSCGMLLAGRPSLACSTQILHIARKDLTVASLPNLDIIKDLVPDLTTFFEKHISIHPYVVRDDGDEMLNPTGEFYQSMEELISYLQFTYCIKCGLCISACPTLATDQEYIGPQALAQAYRYSKDTRDDGFSLRKNVAGGTHGAFRCHYAGECSNVCPKGVDPARAIQLMKRDLVLDYLKLRRRKVKSHVCSRPEVMVRPPEIPEPPPFTVDRK